MGDFNLHIESQSSDHRQLTGILEHFDLNQHVKFPTHIHGHSLDVMIFSKGCDVLSVSPSDAISDHFSVIADLKIPTDHSHTVSQTITYRKLKAINMEAFKADITNSDLIKNPKSNATELAQQYDSVLSTLIDFHAPLVTKKISTKPPNRWMTPTILASKRHRRYLERVCRRYPTALNRSRLSKQIHLCNRQMSKAKSDHYSKIIADDEVLCLVLSAPCKSSDLDPIPTSWVKDVSIYISYANSVYSQLIALRGMFPVTFQVRPSLPSVEKAHAHEKLPASV